MNMSLISHLDHLVLTVANIERSCTFYSTVLQMEEITFNGRKALKFGESKINHHEIGHEYEPKATYPTTGPRVSGLVITRLHGGKKAREVKV